MESAKISSTFRSVSFATLIQDAERSRLPECFKKVAEIKRKMIMKMSF
jgi:hypothetical protein